jgi:hypothetical protein
MVVVEEMVKIIKIKTKPVVVEVAVADPSMELTDPVEMVEIREKEMVKTEKRVKEEEVEMDLEQKENLLVVLVVKQVMQLHHQEILQLM